ncbi:MAG TPA: ubiquinone/menaquinone biosynthesis methyltransferase [Actinomycetota bacterium]|nr:ubiquinone/menaquinone biosynthesis methyltransferase [Actinomycetota bacterium]
MGRREVGGGDLPPQATKATEVRAMFDRIAPRYDLVNRVMTFGLDRLWRRRAVAALRLQPSARTLDVACGTGDLCTELQRVGFFAIGCDLSLGMLRSATTSAPLIQCDALRLPFESGSFDGVTCGFALRNVVDITAVVSELARVTRRGGRVSVIEVAQPRARILRAGHGFYFNRVVPLIGRALSDGPAYRYLPKSVTYLPPQLELLTIFRDAGFPDAFSSPLGVGAAQLITATRE